MRSPTSCGPVGWFCSTLTDRSLTSSPAVPRGLSPRSYASSQRPTAMNFLAGDMLGLLREAAALGDEALTGLLADAARDAGVEAAETAACCSWVTRRAISRPAGRRAPRPSV